MDCLYFILFFCDAIQAEPGLIGEPGENGYQGDKVRKTMKVAGQLDPHQLYHRRECALCRCRLTSNHGEDNGVYSNR